MYCYQTAGISHYYDDLALAEAKDDSIREMMKNKREQIYHKLSAVMSVEYVTDFARLLADGWNDERDEALRIADDLDIDKQGFAALNDDIALYAELEIDSNNRSQVDPYDWE